MVNETGNITLPDFGGMVGDSLGDITAPQPIDTLVDAIMGAGIWVVNKFSGAESWVEDVFMDLSISIGAFVLWVIVSVIVTIPLAFETKTTSSSLGWGVWFTFNLFWWALFFAIFVFGKIFWEMYVG